MKTKKAIKKPSNSSFYAPVVQPLTSTCEASGRRWMLFVDGENFTMRAQECAKKHGILLKKGQYYEPNIFAWIPYLVGRRSIVPHAPITIQNSATRAYYYTSAVGDERKLQSVRQTLWELGFQAEVFKKDKQSTKSKGVDIALAKDFLSNAFLNNYDVAVLIAGDADYVPMVSEVKRLGKLVYVIFFHGDGSGLSMALHLASDMFFKIDDSFITDWKKYLAENQE